MEELIKVIEKYFESRKINFNHWEIIDIHIISKVEFSIILRNIGKLIGRDGYRIKDLEQFISEHYRIPIKINAIKHIEWYNLKK